MVSIFLCLDDVCIQSDVVVVHSVMHYKILQFSKWWKNFCKTPQTWIKVIYGNSRKVKKQFARRRKWFYLQLCS